MTQPTRLLRSPLPSRAASGRRCVPHSRGRCLDSLSERGRRACGERDCRLRTSRARTTGQADKPHTSPSELTGDDVLRNVPTCRVPSQLSQRHAATQTCTRIRLSPHANQIAPPQEQASTFIAPCTQTADRRQLQQARCSSCMSVSVYRQWWWRAGRLRAFLGGEGGVSSLLVVDVWRHGGAGRRQR